MRGCINFNMKKFIRIIKILIMASPFVLFGWLFCANYVPGGVMEITYNFERSPWVSAFRPGHRISEIKKEEDNFKYQSITDDPVYFDLSLPVNFEYVKLEIDFRNFQNQLFKIGAYTSRENWEFLFKEFEIISENGEWKTGRVEFETAYLDKPNNQLTFVFSTPEIREVGGSIDVREIRVVATK